MAEQPTTALPDDATLEALATRFVQHATSVDTDVLRARVAGADLESWSPPLAVALVGRLVRRARDHAAAADALAALSRALATGLVDPDHLAACAAAARSRADRLVEAVFGAGPASREYVSEEEQFVDRKLKALTLGERRALTRTNDPDWLARLAHDQDPRVVAELLRNPRATEREAIIAASRRPTHGEVLDTVLKSRFGIRSRVRRAVANNPYAPVALACRALATLTTVELREIIENPHVSGEVRRHAQDLRRGRGTTAAERARRLAATGQGADAALTDDPELASLLRQLAPEDGDDRLEIVRDD